MATFWSDSNHNGDHSTGRWPPKSAISPLSSTDTRPRASNISASKRWIRRVASIPLSIRSNHKHDSSITSIATSTATCFPNAPPPKRPPRPCVSLSLQLQSNVQPPPRTSSLPTHRQPTPSRLDSSLPARPSHSQISSKSRTKRLPSLPPIMVGLEPPSPPFRRHSIACSPISGSPSMPERLQPQSTQSPNPPQLVASGLMPTPPSASFHDSCSPSPTVLLAVTKGMFSASQDEKDQCLGPAMASASSHLLGGHLSHVEEWNAVTPIDDAEALDILYSFPPTPYTPAHPSRYSAAEKLMERQPCWSTRIPRTMH